MFGKKKSAHKSVTYPAQEENEQEFPVAPEPSVVEPPRNDRDHIDTVVGPSVRVQGDFSSEGNMIIRGEVLGNVTTSQLLTSEDGSIIWANVEAADAIIAGTVRGNVYVKEQLEIMPSALVFGDIYCRVLVVEAGAQLKGKVDMHDMEVPVPPPGVEPPVKKRTVKRVTKKRGPVAQTDE